MGWFTKLSAKAKILLAFLTVAGILGGVAILALCQMKVIDGMVGEIYSDHLVRIAAIKEANIELLKLGKTGLWGCLSTDKGECERYVQGMQEQADLFQKQLAVVEKSTDTAAERTALTRLKEDFPKYHAKLVEAIRAQSEGKTEEVIARLGEARAVAGEVDKACEELERLDAEAAQDAFEQSGEKYNASFWMVSICVAIGTLTALLLGWLLARWFTKALLEVASIAHAVASASQQLAAASEELSTGAQEQASSLEETAASLEEITGTIQQNADNAQQANQLAGSSREVAEKGGEVVGRAVQGMSEINSASKKIADIITAIDEIAFQTNLLALNAAVEAARAGEQGRGFAVVAGEVRNLAQRSAGAAKEIKGLIQDSVVKVENGSKLVNQSGQTLDEIVGSVKRVTDIVSEIAAASQEQAGGIEQVNKAVTQMDQVTQANASQTEELSSTAESLAAQAAQLQEVVAQFNLSSNGVRQAAPLRTSSRPTTVRRTTSPTKKAAARPQPRPLHDVESAVEQELELVKASSHGHGFEEF